MKYRYEQFGGIIASDDPPFLAFVDRDYMAGCGLPPSGLWEGTPLPPGILTAPTEVHFAVTNRCSAGCSHCYMDGGNPDPGELDTGQMKAALEILAGMGVFHIAMGGGEALEREDLFELAEYARGCGLVPNLTVSGRGITAENAASMKVFGQVNISLDGVGINSGIYRGTDQFETADRAFRLLREHGMQPGINCVLGRKNLKEIGNLFRYARSREVEEIEFLRFKPSGRGKADYLDNRLTYEQNILLAALLADSSKRYGVTAKIDCSLVPMLCYSLP
ncbi:MAG TPA: radical SAM protein, partial [Bacteroidales bacterium]|nr:radical SAM protein [Bacteroidales bacterium]